MNSKTREQTLAEQHGYTTNSIAVNTFYKGDLYVWRCFTGWARAVFIGTSVVGGKRIYADLENALVGNDDTSTYKMG